MKFLVLALCIAAANAATFAKPYQVATQAASVAAQVVTSPARAAAAVVRASGSDVDAPILRSESDVTAEGFNFNYETGNGISATATGALKKIDNNQEAVVIQGSYQYTAPDGTPVQVNYVADENGYQPQSDLLPVAPAIPEAIARSLAYIAAHPQPVDAKKF